ncbi:MAG: ABC transporter permease [Gemmatimonadaceae bacterium]
MSAPPPRSTTRTLFSLAWRESRSTRRRLLLYMSSISLGVAALVAIDSYAGNITRSVREQSRSLLGGDVALFPRGAFTPRADSLLDSLAGTGVTIAKETTFGSMALVPRSGGTRFSQIRAVTAGFPLYGAVVTEPAGEWNRLHDAKIAIVDPSLLVALGAQVGDSLSLGYASFVITASLTSVPGNPGGMASTFAPRIYISDRFVPETRLLTFGSRADHDGFARLPRNGDAESWVETLRTRFDSAGLRARTVSQREDNLAEEIDQLANFLGIVGIIALLLGGVGVASGVNAWVARKIDIVAVLRCLGATSRQVMLIYATQASLMGLLGAAAGAALGVAIQFALPNVIGQYLPVEVDMAIEPVAIASGVLLGVWIALAFALRPLVAIRRISPLQAIRRTVDPTGSRRRGRDWAVIAVNVFIAATVIGISATRSNSLQEVGAFSGGIAAVLVLLWVSAVGVSRGARRALRQGWPYVVRQGIANLYRPANQTRAVVLSLGFGAFLVSTLYLVQSNLLKQIEVTQEASRGNLIFFDVQGDQGAGMDSIVRGTPGVELLQRVPIVTMRIAAVNGKPVRRTNPNPVSDSVQQVQQSQEGNQSGPPSGWAARREYRSTFRDSASGSERIVAGTWFGQTPAKTGAPADEVSLETSIAQDLGVSLGDVITWDVQGAKVETRITSLREVNWARFETNFFAVFPTKTLAAAPQTYVLLAAAPDAPSSGEVQRRVVQRFPNVASIDLSLIRKTIADISQRATTAIRFLTLFSLAMGIPVLFSAVAATRRERVREGVLLKTLGATRRQIGRILLSEYALLGVLGALTGLVLSFGGAWAIMMWVFDRPFAAAIPETIGIGFAMLVMAVGIGLLSGRDVFKETAMTALREV